MAKRTATITNRMAAVVIIAAVLSVGIPGGSGFSVIPRTGTGATLSSPYSSSGGRLFASSPNGGGDDDPASDLTNTLARLDEQWKIQQRRGTSRSRWTKIVLPPQNNGSNSNAEQEIPMSSIAAAAQNSMVSNDEFVYLLEPPEGRPSCVVVFVGGAGLGQFPNVAYNEFLTRLSDRLNAAVITAPYSIGLDHFALSKRVGELSRRAVAHCQEDPSRMYPPSLPAYCLSHSLGCKLSTIYVAATQQFFDGIGFISYNNFGFSHTIGMAKEFAEQLEQSTMGGGFGGGGAGTGNGGGRGTGFGGGNGNRVLDQVFAFAETVVGTIGIDFSPTPKDLERLVNIKYAPDAALRRKIRFFTFDDDTLDSSESIVDAFTPVPSSNGNGNGSSSSRNGNGAAPDVSGLPGTHLTPVFFKFDVNELPEEARDVAREATNGFQSASFGSEQELNDLVSEVSNWILHPGDEPSRPPRWRRPQEQQQNRSERPRIAGS